MYSPDRAVCHLGTRRWTSDRIVSALHRALVGFELQGATGLSPHMSVRAVLAAQSCKGSSTHHAHDRATHCPHANQASNIWLLVTSTHMCLQVRSQQPRRSSPLARSATRSATTYAALLTQLCSSTSSSRQQQLPQEATRTWKGDGEGSWDRQRQQPTWPQQQWPLLSEICAHATALCCAWHVVSLSVMLAVYM